MSEHTPTRTPGVAGPGYPPPARPEPAWPAWLAVFASIALQVLLPPRLNVGSSRYIVPLLEAALLVGLMIASPMVLEHGHRIRRSLALSMTAFVSVANIASLALLAHYMLRHKVSNGRELIISGSLIWLTNVLIFGLWYWETDRGGPGRRAAGRDRAPDLLFPQMSDERYAPPGWRPGFVDYLYVSFTNATAFSPTDTMPLSGGAKSMMGLQALVSLVTIGLVVSRAVSLLPQ